MNIEEEFQFDVRIQDRMLKKGVINKDELAQRLEGLSDVESLSEPTEVEQPGLAPKEVEAEETTDSQ